MTAPYDKSNEEQDDLDLDAETVKDLDAEELDTVRGGLRPPNDTVCTRLDTGC